MCIVWKSWLACVCARRWCISTLDLCVWVCVLMRRWCLSACVCLYVCVDVSMVLISLCVLLSLYNRTDLSVMQVNWKLFWRMLCQRKNSLLLGKKSLLLGKKSCSKAFRPWQQSIKKVVIAQIQIGRSSTFKGTGHCGFRLWARRLSPMCITRFILARRRTWKSRSRGTVLQMLFQSWTWLRKSNICIRSLSIFSLNAWL